MNRRKPLAWNETSGYDEWGGYIDTHTYVQRTVRVTERRHRRACGVRCSEWLSKPHPPGTAPEPIGPCPTCGRRPR